MRVYRGPRRALCLTLTAVALAGCTIQIPTGSLNGATVSEPPSGPASPSGTARATSGPGAGELPPQTVAQIREQDMTFGRGAYIGRSDQVGLAGGLVDAPGWTQSRDMVNGVSVYTSASGCEVTVRSTNAQDPLVVAGDDKASTQELFRYQEPSLLTEQLKTTTWRWGTSPEEAKATVEFLTYSQAATGTTPASAVSMRLFAGTRTAIVFTVACPADDQVRSAVEDLRSRVSVVPPDN